MHEKKRISNKTEEEPEEENWKGKEQGKARRSMRLKKRLML